MKLFHYTDANALKSVLENGKVWLSDIRFLNDHNEYKDGEENIVRSFDEKLASENEDDSNKIKTALSGFIDSSKSSYTMICSFSQGEDLLSQWRGYCPKLGGYAIEFTNPDMKGFIAPLHECIYEDEKKKSATDSLFDLAKKVLINKKGDRTKLFQTTWSNIAKFKNRGFSEEREMRLIVFKKKDDQSIKFRVRESLIIPYIESDIPYEKISAIWIGPCIDSALAKESLSSYLLSLSKNPKHPFSKIGVPEIKISAVSYRG